MALNGQTDPFDLVRAEVLLVGYDARWSADMDRYEVLAVEAEFRAPLVNPDSGAASRTWILGGKLDVVVRDMEKQQNEIVEHKTASGDVGPGSDYLKRLRLDGQISAYYAGAEALGFPVDGALYDVLVKPGQRPSQIPIIEDGAKVVLGLDGARVRTKDGKKWRETADAAQGYVLQTRPEKPEEYRERLVEAVASDPNAYFMRADVVRLEEEMREAMADVWQLGQSLHENSKKGRFPRNPDACFRYGRSCSFFPVCSGEASLDDPSLFRRSEIIHPELSENADHRLLSASRLSCARACQRLHRFKYVEGYRPATEADALRFGSLIHKGLEAWWRASDGERLEAALAAINPQDAQPVSAAMGA